MHRALLTNGFIYRFSRLQGFAPLVGRSWSTSEAPEKKPSLKSLLMRFYLMVHPDVFTSHPKEKDVNTRSFQLLQAVLDEFKEQRPSGSPTIHQLEFYYRPRTKPPNQEGDRKPSLSTERQQMSRVVEAVTGGSTAATDEALRVEFSKVAVRLKSFSSREDVNVQRREFERTLAGLFATCGLGEGGFDSSKVFGSTDGPATAAADEADDDDLLSFLQENAIIARERITIGETGGRGADLVATCLYIQHRLRTVFELPAQALQDGVLHFSTRLQLLQTLQTLLEETAMTDGGRGLLDNINGMTVAFTGSPSRVDGSGRLCLQYKDHANWRAVMKTVDPMSVITLKSVHKHRQDHEAELAKKLGISLIYADYDGQNSPEYLGLLQQIDSAIGRGVFGPVPTTLDKGIFSDTLPDLKLRIARAPKPIESDEEHGVLVVPFQVTPEQLRQTIIEQGANVVSRHRLIKAENDKLAKLVLDVKRRFRILRLNWDKRLSNMRVSACCAKLLSFQDDLVPFLSSVNVMIGHEYGLEDDGTLIIKWDFDMPRKRS
eukprot:TRINITY_DN7480_c0_g1_i1.p1 TRINITY_DN7480_c0_g1~~TRINITY_DN7480_c0_g1_i1.p1  ORF type:complete len:546 (-),score=194.16 TRINITY_DN7480_c0_g1_i1:189-1826(-)